MLCEPDYLVEPGPEVIGEPAEVGDGEVSVFMPMQHVPSCESRVIIGPHPGSGPNGYIPVIREPAMPTR